MWVCGCVGVWVFRCVIVTVKEGCVSVWVWDEGVGYYGLILCFHPSSDNRMPINYNYTAVVLSLPPPSLLLSHIVFLLICLSVCLSVCLSFVSLSLSLSLTHLLTLSHTHYPSPPLPGGSGRCLWSPRPTGRLTSMR